MTGNQSLSGKETTAGFDHNEGQTPHEFDDPRLSVLAVLASITESGSELAVYDLPQATGLGLPEAFACVRQLEIDRMVRVEDNPTDAFGAKLTLLEAGAEALSIERARRTA